MTNLQQTWLVARREMRERSRSTAFRASVLITLLAVVAVIVLPSLLTSGKDRKKVGFTGTTPPGLATLLPAQGEASGLTIRISEFTSRAAGEDAVRRGKLDALLVDGSVIEWRRLPDDRLRVLVTGAVQTAAVQERASKLGVSANTLAALLSPVSVGSVALGSTHGASPDDESAAFVMTVVLFIAISTYGGLVLSGVVEEKASRVVEVLLARMPARNLLAGKVVGIGLLGLAQIAATAIAALVAATFVDSVDVPAVRASVMLWVAAWFVLGYSLYAMVFGALGSLASRAEDAQSVAAPVTVLLVVGYFLSFAAIGSPDSLWARLVALFPLTAPLSMPNRIAVGAAAWWEPVVGAALTLLTIAVLVRLAGRLYSRAILHGGATVSPRAAWRFLR